MADRLKGFSLIELLVVTAVVLIIAAITIPNLLRSRMAANEASAVGSIHAINTAVVAYNFAYSNGFPPSLAALTQNFVSKRDREFASHVCAQHPRAPGQQGTGRKI